jgi:hypothetical protein
MPRREMTPGEREILEAIQRIHGSQNDEEEVFFASADEAVLFVKSVGGKSIMMVNISNLAAWRADGSIASELDLERDWLIP